MAICTAKWSSLRAGHDCIGPTKAMQAPSLGPVSACVVQLAVCCTVYSVNCRCRTAQHFEFEISFVNYLKRWFQCVHDGWVWAPSCIVERPQIMRKVHTEVCIHTSGAHGYAFLYVLPRCEARGTSRLVRYIEDYVIANYVIASQVSIEFMLFRRGLSVIVRNSEGRYIKVRPVLR